MERCTKAEYDVSVILLTYNSDYEKTIRSISTIINQRNVKLQLVIADDGSEKNNLGRIDEFLKKAGFLDYKLVRNKKNQGTVLNLLTGAEVADGCYMKVLSPGDCLYDEFTLKGWIDFIIERNLSWAFCNTVYYYCEGTDFVPVVKEAHPVNLHPYSWQKNRECRWNYIVLDDIALGAAVLSTKDVQVKYLKKIAGRVKYGEDNIWRLMMFDNIVGGYYPKCGVYYEFGAGISTSSNDKWMALLKKDFLETCKIMESGLNLDKFQKKIIRALKYNQLGRISYFLVQGKLFFRIFREFFGRKTICETVNIKW